MSQVTIGRRAQLQVFGDDWPTTDGTGERDNTHTMNFAEGHRTALDCLLAVAPQPLSLDLRSWQGQSVLEVIHAMEAASDRSIPDAITDRRPGIAAVCVADPRQANERLGWHTQRSLEDICLDNWAWQQQNPEGYTLPANVLPTNPGFMTL